MIDCPDWTFKGPASIEPSMIDEAVGQRLRMRREELALPIVDLAAWVGIGVDTLIDIEAGRVRADARTLYLSSQVLKIDPNYFFEDLEKLFPDLWTAPH